MTADAATMRAIVIARPGGPEVLEERERPRPEPGLGEIRVRVRASALNRADLIQRRGAYPAPAGAPADIPGLEYAGEVEAVGPGAMLWAPGTRVMGIVGGGGHAEYLCVHEREALPVPEGLTWEEAAAIPEVFLTAYDALVRQMGLRVGERLLIHAVGSGVGTAALQLARAAGALVIGTSRTASKLERARALGLEHGVDGSRDDWDTRVLALTGGEGVHVVMDLVGGPYTPRSVRALASRGRIVLVGTPAGARAEFDLGLLLRRRASITGTVLRARPHEEKAALAREFADAVLPLFDAGRLRPVIDRVLPFAAIREAHEALERDETFGKVVLAWR
ncbi:MAG TPA: NAD(P)H-quinone oxidoreductase [Gemmatimonadaceae bacterium]